MVTVVKDNVHPSGQTVWAAALGSCALPYHKENKSMCLIERSLLKRSVLVCTFLTMIQKRKIARGAGTQVAFQFECHILIGNNKLPT